MTAIRGRPVLMQRFPSGVDGSNFFQKRVPKERPDWLETSVVSTPNGTTSEALVAADLAHIVWAVNLGCLGFHVWPNLARDDDHADELRIDLDPQPGLGFDEVREAARELKGLLDELGIRGLAQDHRQPRHPRVHAPRTALDTDRGAPRGGGGGTRARPTSTRRDHRRVVEGRARAIASSSTSTRTHRTRRCSARGRSGRARPPRCRRRSTGTSSTTSIPRRAPRSTVPDRVESRGDPWADIADDPQVAHAAARDVRPRHRIGARGRTVAARLPEDARRTAASLQESSAEGRRRQSDHATATEEAEDAATRSQARRLNYAPARTKPDS